MIKRRVVRVEIAIPGSFPNRFYWRCHRTKDVSTGSWSLLEKCSDGTHLGNLKYFLEWHSRFNLDCYFCVVAKHPLS